MKLGLIVVGLALSTCSIAQVLTPNESVQCDIYKSQKLIERVTTNAAQPESCLMLPESLTKKTRERVKSQQAVEYSVAKANCAKIPFYKFKKKKACQEDLASLATDHSFHLHDLENSAYSACIYTFMGEMAFSARRHHAYGTTIPETFFIKREQSTRTGISLDISKQALEVKGIIKNHFEAIHPLPENSDIIVECGFVP
ncbi:MAG: hypothetical protein ACOYL6_17300 [Bacteriovoracaceae bacterium]